MDLRPFDPSIDKPIQTVGQNYATEYVKTVVDPMSGKWMLVPSIWFRADGSPTLISNDDEAAFTAAYYSMTTGAAFPTFSSREEADQWARGRSQSGGATKGLLSR